MVGTKDLPYLVRLFDDESPSVRRAVVSAMRDLGPSLSELLREMPTSVDEPRIAQILSAVSEEKGSDGPGGAREKSTGAAHEKIEERAPTDRSLFMAGQLVMHRRYGYRGVIVDFDEHCRANEEWYRSNRTQPPRRQPWYHVLVDGSDQVTYVAQTNLEEDEDGRPVQHPLLASFFEGFKNGRHLRNQRPWSGSDGS